MKKAFLFFFLFNSVFSLIALPFIGFESGLLFIITTESGGSPNPAILQGIGITLPLLDEDLFYLDTGLLLFGTWYQYLNERAIIADIERADTIWVLQLHLFFQGGLNFKVSDWLSLGLALGPALIFPFPLIANDNGEKYLASMYNFFYSNLKFLYAQAELYLRWQIVKEFNLKFKIRSLYPLATIWDVPEISKANGLMFQALVCLEKKL